MNVLVSVVVPVYNLGEYLDTCLYALRRQTLKETEIICVDDGSTDNSLDILKKHAGEDKRIIVRQQKNQGAGPARNNALSAATGKYVVFMDGDDLYPSDDTLEKMVAAAKKHNVRVVAGYRSMLKGGKAFPDKGDPLYKLASDNPDGKLLSYRDVQFDFNYQAYLYERSIITDNKLEFPDYRRFQDPPFFVKAMIAADKFFLIPESTYLYRWGHQNINWTPRKINDMVMGHIDNLITSSEHKLTKLHATTASRLGGRYKKLISSCVCLENPKLYALIMRADGLTERKILKEEKENPNCIKELLNSMDDRYGSIFCRDDSIDCEFLLKLLKDLSKEYELSGGKREDFVCYAIAFLGKILRKSNRVALTNSIYELVNSNDSFISELFTDAGRSKNSDIRKTAAFLSSLSSDKSEEVKVSVILTPSLSQDSTVSALDTLSGQSLGDIEIICPVTENTDVTDGVLCEYAKKSKRTVVLNIPGSSAQAAMNKAIESARGKYMLFLTADDTFNRTMVKSVFDRAEEKNADIVIFKNKYSDLSTGKPLYSVDSINKKYIKSADVFSKDTVPGNIASVSSTHLCNKLFRKSFLTEKSISFNEADGRFEISFVILSLCLADRITYIEKELTDHRLNDSGDKETIPCAVKSFLLAKKELTARGLYEKEERGFVNSAVTALASFLDRIDGSRKMKLFREICSDEMTESGILLKDDSFYDNLWSLCKLKGAEKALEWSTRIDGFKRDSQTVLIKEATCDDPYISVIIPVYNVEKYVEECLESVLNQTFDNYEVICIDDGSTDSSRQIVLDTAEKDGRISVYRQLNSGLSETRNNGVRVARGKYVYFLDSDDYLVPDALELLYDKVSRDELDAVFFDASSFTDSEGVSAAKYDGYYNRKHSYDGVFTGIELMRRMFENGEYRVSACLQMVKKEHFINNDLFFLRGIIYEDNPFTFKNLLLAKRAGYIGESLYMRRVRNDSIMTASVTFKNPYSYFRCFLYMEKFFDGYTNDNEAGMDAAGNILHAILMSGKYAYEKMPAVERWSTDGLSAYERNLFALYISEPCSDRIKLRSQNAVKSSSVKKLRAYLKKVKKLMDKSSSPSDFAKRFVKAVIKKLL